MFRRPKKVLCFCGGGQNVVKVVGEGGGGGSVILFYYYSIRFLGQDINWDIILSSAPVAIFIYFTLICFSLSNVFYIFMYILTDNNDATKSIKLKLKNSLYKNHILAKQNHSSLTLCSDL